MEEAQPVVGTCLEMCAELERNERERKGDLDKFERVDGARHVTNKSLAVKKYSRVADRNPAVLRPLPVLQKTLDHLLGIINCSYNDDFLSMYNFLWDRMRAIRMDIRLQQIFDKEAVRMYEQMIRFHTIAMHELNGYTKVQHLAECFDLHLNIEQMNKAFIELFGMYGYHKKHGYPFPTEPEFRGYYLLLKLDKYPQYMVEASDLSLDLANMTPEMRSTQEVLFARDAIRASRSANFIRFFRLARKATYLQACLMHAHFAKMRMQALVSLHCGLQKSRGIPVSDILRWLGMEEQDVRSLLEYHGFTLKQFEELYMIKEGPFLNREHPFPSKRCPLVRQKSSEKVFSDVVPPGYM